jgi:hypothetical protein
MTFFWGSLAVLAMNTTLLLPLPLSAVAQPEDAPLKKELNERPATGTDKPARVTASPITTSLGTSLDDVTQVLEEAERRPQPLFKFGPLTPLGNAWDGVNKKLDRAIGLNLGLSYAMLYQHAEQAQGSRNASGGNFRFFGAGTSWIEAANIQGFWDFFLKPSMPSQPSRQASWGTNSAPFGEPLSALTSKNSPWCNCGGSNISSGTA